MEIAIITPSSPCKKEAFAAGLDILKSWGHTPLLSPLAARAPQRYLAGSREERLKELNWALTSSAPFIMAARGGYGLHQLLPYLDNEAIAAAGKPLMGFSDITALHQVWLKNGAPVYHGPNVTTLAKLDEESLRRTRALLAGAPEWPNLPEITVDLADDAEGDLELIGGNLAMLASLMGTPYLYRPHGSAVLFLEDVGEAPYRLDRLLHQLYLGGYFAPVKLVLLGEFVSCDPESAAGYKALDVLLEFFAEIAIPALAGFPSGHGVTNYPICLGRLSIN